MSAIPAVLDALLAAARSSAVLVDEQVFDGPSVDELEADGLFIGYDPFGEPAVQTVEAARGIEVVSEEFDVLCLARSSYGDPELKPVRDRAFAIVAALRAELKRDQTLGGVATDARISGLSYVPDQDAGAIVEVPFRVRVRVL